MIADPASAPPRPDVTFLRRRSRPKPAAPSPVADFIAGRVNHPRRHDGSPQARPAAAPSGSLDLSEASAPAAPASAAVAPSGSLDLSDAPAPAAPAARPPAAPALPLHRDRRVRAGEQHLLSLKAPTVTLTRVQSGIGQLTIEAVCSPEVGDLRLGALYQMTGGASSTVQHAGGTRFGPSARQPVILAGHDEYEVLHLDLRRGRQLERLAIYAFSESRTELTWGGTLVLTTFGRARVELPLDTLHRGRVAVLASIYNLDGEFVIRAEMETIFEGDIRGAARAYGYDRITWRDDRSPAD